MKKRILSLALTICMVLTLMPTIALAADMTELYIGSTTAVILPDNGKYTYGDATGGAETGANTLAEIPATATWYLHKDDSPTPKYTLTLKNFTYSGEGNSGTGFGSGIYAIGDLTIELVGDNSVTQAGGQLPSFGIYADGALTVQGSGNLSATGGNVTNATKDDLFNSHGIYSSGKITIKGSAHVTATGGRSENDSYGLAGQSVKIEGNAQVTAVAGTAPKSKIGIHGGTGGFTATGGTTLARGGLYAIFTDSRASITADDRQHR